MGKALGTPSTLIPYSVSSRRDRFQIIIILPFTFVSHDIFNVKRINIYYKSIRPFGVYGHGLQVSPLTGGGKSLRHPTQNNIILQGEQIICVTTVTLRRIGRSSELLDYSLVEALLRVYSFEFAALQPNSTGCNESKSRGILSIRKLFRREPLQLYCLRI